MTGEVAYAAEISEDRHQAAIVSAGRELDGVRLVVNVVYYAEPRGVVSRLTALSMTRGAVAVVVDPRSQGATLLDPLAAAGVFVTQPTTADVVVAHGEFLDAVTDGVLVHLGQEPLTLAVRAAQQRPLGGGRVWDRRNQDHGADLASLLAATLACWGFRRWEEVSAPEVWAI